MAKLISGRLPKLNVGITSFSENQTTLSVVGISSFSDVVLNGSLSAGGTTGVLDQYLKSVGTGVSWATFPTLRTENNFSATSGQTSFTVSYTVGFIDVFVNGVRLTTSEYTATNGTSVVLSEPCFSGDAVDILAYNTTSTSGSGSGSGISTEYQTLNDVLGLGNTSTLGMSVGVVTATSYKGSGSTLSGIVTYITAGSGISVNQNTGNVTITATGGSQTNYWNQTSAGIHTLSNVGIGTTNPTSTLTVSGAVQIQQDSSSNNRLILRGQPSSSYRWNIDNYSSSNDLRIFREDDATSANGTVAVSINSSGTLNAEKVFTSTDSRLQSVSEKSTVVSGNTVSLVYNTGGGNVAICTNPTGAITLNVTGVPTDSSFDNRTLNFTVIVIQSTTGYACTTINLNGVSRTVKYPGGVVSVASTSSYDIFNFTGINTVGSGSTTSNYQILGMLNGNFK